MAKTKSLMTQEAAKRIQSAEAKANDGKVATKNGMFTFTTPNESERLFWLNSKTAANFS